MPLLFSLGQKKALTSVAAELHKGEQLFAFHDDLYVTAQPNRVVDIYHSLPPICGTMRGSDWNKAGLFPGVTMRWRMLPGAQIPTLSCADGTFFLNLSSRVSLFWGFQWAALSPFWPSWRPANTMFCGWFSVTLVFAPLLCCRSRNWPKLAEIEQMLFALFLLSLFLVFSFVFSFHFSLLFSCSYSSLSSVFLFCFCFRPQKPELNPKPRTLHLISGTPPLDPPPLDPPSAGQPAAGLPRISLLFPFPATIFILSSSLGGRFGGVIEASGPSNVHALPFSHFFSLSLGGFSWNFGGVRSVAPNCHCTENDICDHWMAFVDHLQCVIPTSPVCGVPQSESASQHQTSHDQWQ